MKWLLTHPQRRTLKGLIKEIRTKRRIPDPDNPPNWLMRWLGLERVDIFILDENRTRVFRFPFIWQKKS